MRGPVESHKMGDLSLSKSRPVRKSGDVSMSPGLRSNAAANSAVDVNPADAHGIGSAIRPITSKRRVDRLGVWPLGRRATPKPRAWNTVCRLRSSGRLELSLPRVWADCCSVLLRGCRHIPSLGVSRHCICRRGSSRGRISRVLPKTGLAGIRTNTSSNFRARGLN